MAEDASDDEAGIDPDRAVAQSASFYDTFDAPTTKVERLVATNENRVYMEDLRKSDQARADLAEDLLAMHQDMQVTLADARAARQHAVARALGPISLRLEQILDSNVIFPAAFGGAKAHKYVHIARRAFAEEESLANMFFGEGARSLGGERIHKEFEQCCSALKKLHFDGAKDKDTDNSPRGERGGRGGKKKQQQQQHRQQQ